MCMRSVFVLLTILARSPVPASAQQVVYLVRHADRAGEDLSQLGRAQPRNWPACSRTLVSQQSTLPTSTELARLPHPSKRCLSRKASLFGAPHRARRGLALCPPGPRAPDRVREQAPPEDHVRANHPAEVVLIVGHDNTVPAVIKALGHKPDVTIRTTEFDNLFVVTPRSATAAARSGSPPRAAGSSGSSRRAGGSRRRRSRRSRACRPRPRWPAPSPTRRHCSTS